MDATYFVGYAPRWITPDRLYLVVGLSGALMGLRVGGQLMRRAESQPSDPYAYIKPKLAARYLGRNLLDPALCNVDSRNFFLPSAEVTSARIKTRRALWTGHVPNVGSLFLHLRSARTLRFILLGKQDYQHVASVLVTAGVPIDESFRAAAT